MAYESLVQRLSAGPSPRGIVALPDGSVDTYYHVREDRGDRIETRAAFGERIAAGDSRSFELVERATRAGGQSVNTARQAHALGAPVTLYGHLNHPELGPFPFETHSMGAPAKVEVLVFERDELMLSVESESIARWSVEDLLAALPARPDEAFADRVVCAENWVAFPGMDEALDHLADYDLAGVPVVFDPGDVTGATDGELAALRTTLRSLADTCDLVVTANEAELAYVADRFGLDDAPGLRSLQSDLGARAVVLHDERRATVASDDEQLTVPNFEGGRIVRRTGAGDRFDAGLAYGLAADWPWAATLALGNACASYFVEHGESATRSDLVEYVRRKDSPV